MTPEHGPNPEFLRPGIETTSKIQGSFTEVTRLDGLPPEILEKLPAGYVLKEYRTDAPDQDLRDKTLFGPAAPKLSLLEKARILKERQAAVADFFKEDLPDLVVRSDFFVGRGADNQPHMYELQPNIAKTIDVLGSSKIVQQFLDQARPEVRQHFLDQLERFVARGRVLLSQHDNPTLKNRTIDLHGENNLVGTPTGDVRLVDTNYLFELDSELYQTYGEQLDKLQGHVSQADLEEAA